MVKESVGVGESRWRNPAECEESGHHACVCMFACMCVSYYVHGHA